MKITSEADLEDLYDLFALDQNSGEIVILDASGRAWIIIDTDDGLYAWGSWWEDDGPHTARRAEDLTRPLTVLSPTPIEPPYDDRMPIADRLASIRLYDPQDLTLVSDGHGDFPNGFELTRAARNSLAEWIETRS